jgi:hypothetical protein
MSSENVIRDTIDFLVGQGVDETELREVIGVDPFAAVVIDTFIEAIRNMQIDLSDPRRWTTEKPERFIIYQLQNANLPIGEEERERVSSGVIAWTDGRLKKYPSIKKLAEIRMNERFA